MNSRRANDRNDDPGPDCAGGSRDPTEIGSPRSVKIMGIGGAGVNILAGMYMSDLKGTELSRVNRTDGPQFCCVQTNADHLLMTHAGKKMLIGSNTTGGKSTNGDPDLGEKAALESEDEILGFLKGGDTVFLIAGLGGGTGAGATRHIARLCKDLGLLTIGIFIMPFEKEEEKKRINAQEALHHLTGICDIALTLNNDLLLKLRPEPSLNGAFRCTGILASGLIEEVLSMLRAQRSRDDSFVPRPAPATESSHHR